MKWLEPKIGETRVVSLYAYLPITIGGGLSGPKETRWLERVNILEEYMPCRTRNDWVRIKFV